MNTKKVYRCLGCGTPANSVLEAEACCVTGRHDVIWNCGACGQPYMDKSQANVCCAQKKEPHP